PDLVALAGSATKASPSPAAAAQFTPFWVQSFRPTNLWSNAGSDATAFGPLPVWSYLQVLRPSSSDRFFVRVAATNNVAYVNRADVGPSSPPPPYLSGGAVKTVMVQPGDTVRSIGARFDVPAEALMAVNHLN